MSPITHFLASWSAADSFKLTSRDLSLVAIAGVAPDLDGLVVLGDLGARLASRPDPCLYGQYHHMLTHGLPAALVFTVLAGLAAAQKVRTAALALLVVHVHLLCDLVGSRGPGTEDLWPIPYLAPVSHDWTLAWGGQWALNAWPNILFTLGLLSIVIVRAVTRGYSPVWLFSPRCDAAFVATLRSRWRA
jgi:inner membrane protein